MFLNFINNMHLLYHEIMKNDNLYYLSFLHILFI